MLPKIQDEWTLDSIKERVNSGCHEPESFDFKGQLPYKNDEPGKQRLRGACCAFANSNGGFLVFGVADAKDATGEDRIVGIDTPDFASEFGCYPSKCEPTVHFDPLPPPIRLDEGKYIQVVYIPRSIRGPHAVKKDDKWVFKKRTNEGDDNMSYDDIRLAFLHNHDRLRRVFLLKIELGEIKYEAEQYLEINTTNPLAKFDLSVLDSLWSDIYPIAHQSAELTDAIACLRRLCRTVNRNAGIIEHWRFKGLGAQVYLDPAWRSNVELLPRIASNATDAIKALKPLLPSAGE